MFGDDDDDEEFSFQEPGDEFFTTLIPTPRSEPDPVVEKVAPEVAEAETEVSRSLPNRKVMTFGQVFHSKEKLKFLIEDVLPDHGIVFIGGLSGTGKTILAIQLVANLVLRRPTMTWHPVEDMPQITTMMLSLEMSFPELQKRLQDQYPDATEEEMKTFEDHFLIHSEEPLHLWRDDHCADLIRLIRMNHVNVLLIDSASVSFAEELTNQAQVNKSLENLNTIRIRLGVCIIIVAHTRKPPPDNSTTIENISINDLFGHSGIAQHASAIFLMYEDEKSRRQTIKDGTGETAEKLVHVVCVKARFGSSNDAFKAKLPSREMTKKGSALRFYRPAIALQPMTKSERAKLNAKADGSAMAEEMKNIDFGSILGGEDDIL